MFKRTLNSSDEYVKARLAETAAAAEKDRLNLTAAREMAVAYSIALDENLPQLEELKQMLLDEVKICWGAEAFVDFSQNEIVARHLDGRKLNLYFKQQGESA